MGVPHYGDFAEDATINIPFNTFSSDDPSASVTVTDLVDTDVYVFKDGSATEYGADAAVAVSINHDGNTGAHMCTIDLSENAYFAAGSEYAVMLIGITVDGATLNPWIAAFSIERAGGTLALLKLIQAAVITNAAGADVAADIIAVKAETALIVADTNELQTDDIPGTLSTIDGKIDTVDGIADDLKAALILVDTTIQSDDRSTTACRLTAGSDDDNVYIGMKVILDDNAGNGEYVSRTITDYVGATNLVTFTPAITEDAEEGGQIYIIPGDTKINVTADAIVADTNELQTDDIPGTLSTIDGKADQIVAATITNAAGADVAADIIAVKAETATIVADTNELQTDDIPGTLSTIDGNVDAILVDTGTTIPGTITTMQGNVTDILADTAELQGDWVDAGRLDALIDSVISLLDDARSEPAQGAPPVNPDAVTKIDYIYKFMRNKVLTSATEIKVYNDAGDTVDQKSAISDDGTDFTRGEFATGP